MTTAIEPTTAATPPHVQDDHIRKAVADAHANRPPSNQPHAEAAGIETFVRLEPGLYECLSFHAQTYQTVLGFLEDRLPCNCYRGKETNQECHHARNLRFLSVVKPADHDTSGWELTGGTVHRCETCRAPRLRAHWYGKAMGYQTYERCGCRKDVHHA